MMTHPGHIHISAIEVRPGMRIGINGCALVVSVGPSKKRGKILLEFGGGRKSECRPDQMFMARPEDVDPYRDPPPPPAPMPTARPVPLSPHAERLRQWMDELTPEQRKEHARKASVARVRKNRAAVEAEREACARLCEKWALKRGRSAEQVETAAELARLIRGASLSTAHTEEQDAETIQP